MCVCVCIVDEITVISFEMLLVSSVVVELKSSRELSFYGRFHLEIAQPLRIFNRDVR